MKETVLAILHQSLSVQEHTVRGATEEIVDAAQRIAAAFSAGNKLVLFGNGGSAADAQHIAAEFVNRFSIERPPLPALALTTDTSVLTAVSNDYSFHDVFTKQIRALAKPGDVALCISTSGNSENVNRAAALAVQKGLFTIGLTGKGGSLARIVDLVLSVDAEHTPRIQETHIVIGHILCELVDRLMFPAAFPAG